MNSSVTDVINLKEVGEPGGVLTGRPRSVVAYGDTIFVSLAQPVTNDPSQLPGLLCIPGVGGAARACCPGYGGCVGLAVFKAFNRAEPDLYISLQSETGPQVLRSDDGMTFAAPRIDGSRSPTLPPFVDLVPFGTWLFGRPSDAAGDRPALFVAADPEDGMWEDALGAALHEPGNEAITAIAVANGHLYVGIRNRLTGFEVWRTSALGEPPFAWEMVLDRGASAYTANQEVFAMTPFADMLYLAAGSGSPALRSGGTGAELLRLASDGSWDLIVGQPRVSATGLKAPFAIMGAGFDDPNKSVITAMDGNGDRLFVAVSRTDDVASGSEIWTSSDGEAFDLFDDAGITGRVTTLRSTELGLVIACEPVDDSRPPRLLFSRADDS